MASLRDRPYAQFNFLVDLGTELGDGPHAGFQEVSGLKKITGLNKSTDVTLKRGVIGAARVAGLARPDTPRKQASESHGHNHDSR